MKKYEQEHKNQVLTILKGHAKLTTNQMSKYFTRSWGYTNKILEKLKEENHIDYERIGTTKVWWYINKITPIVVDGVRQGVITT